MLTTKELRKLRDEKVFTALKKPTKRKKRKPGPSPSDAKMASMTAPVKAAKPPEVKKAEKPPKKSKK